MSKPGNAPIARKPQRNYSIEHLKENPESQENHRRNIEELNEETPEYHGKDPGSWEKQKVPTHHTGDGPTCPDRGQKRRGEGKSVRKTSCKTTSKVEEEELPPAEEVLHVIAKNPEIPHVGEKVEETPVEEDGGQKGEEGRNGKPMEELGLSPEERGDQACLEEE